MKTEAAIFSALTLVAFLLALWEIHYGNAFAFAIATFACGMSCFCAVRILNTNREDAGTDKRA